MPKKLIELEREAAKKEALKLAKEAVRKAVAKKKSKDKAKDELQEDIKVPNVEVKDTNIVSKGATHTATASTTSNITSESFQHVVNKIKSN